MKCSIIIPYYETCLRLVYEGSERKYRKNIVLKNPTLSQLKAILEKDNSIQYTVMCSKKNIDIIIWIQLNVRNSQVLLQTY